MEIKGPIEIIAAKNNSKMDAFAKERSILITFKPREMTIYNYRVHSCGHQEFAGDIGVNGTSHLLG